MNDPIRKLFASSSEQIIAYAPSLFAGLILILVGWFLGWFLKRIAIRLCVILRIDRMFRKMGWAQDLSKADIRFAAYEAIGNLVFVVVFFVFLSSALNVMSLSQLSGLLDKGILFVPRVLISLSIFAIGWLVTHWVSTGIGKALLREEVPRALLIERFAKLVLLLFFSAMALTELDIAREIVVIGFTVIIVTLSALLIVVTIRGDRKFINKILQTLDEE